LGGGSGDRGGGGSGFAFGGGDFGGRLGLQALEILEGTLIVALGGGDAVLEAGEDLAAIVVEGAAEGVEIFRDGGFAGLGVPVPELGFTAAETAEGPLGVDEDIDEAALFGGVGVEAVVVACGEGFEIGGVFVADGFRLGVDAGAEGVLTGGGFTGGGAGAGGLLRIATIRFDLELRGHRHFCLEGSRRVGGNRRGRRGGCWEEKG